MRVQAFLSWFVPVFALYVALCVSRFCRKARRKAMAQAQMIAHRDQARAAKAARQVMREAAKAAQCAEARHKRPRGRPRKEPDSEPTLENRPENIPDIAKMFKGNNIFAREVVAFTGTLDGMTRAEAIRAVEANGGKAFDTMPAGTTLLVVGKNPGNAKLDKADRWIGQCKKITQDHFMVKLTSPLTLTPDEFADAVAALM